MFTARGENTSQGKERLHQRVAGSLRNLSACRSGCHLGWRSVGVSFFPTAYVGPPRFSRPKEIPRSAAPAVGTLRRPLWGGFSRSGSKPGALFLGRYPERVPDHDAPSPFEKNNPEPFRPPGRAHPLQAPKKKRRLDYHLTPFGPDKTSQKPGGAYPALSRPGDYPPG